MPTSKGMPTGIAFTAKTMAEVMRIIPHEPVDLVIGKQGNGTAKLKNHVTPKIEQGFCDWF